MTSTLRVTASNKFTLSDLKTRQIAVRNAFWKSVLSALPTLASSNLNDRNADKSDVAIRVANVRYSNPALAMKRPGRS